MTGARVLLALSALLGGAGVALYALAAHGRWSGLDFAAAMALGHAAALAGFLAARQSGLMAPQASLWALWLMLAAVTLFVAEVVLGAMAGVSLFPRAAPTGGTLAILSWILLALTALLPSRRPA